MSNLFRALLTLGSAFASAVWADACPAIGGTYRKLSADEPAPRILVIQDQCQSVTFLYANDRRGFTSASPRFEVDGAWHRSVSGAEYRAIFKGGQLRVTWRSEARDVLADGFAWGVDELGMLGQAVPHPDGKSKLTTYFEPLAHHQSPTKEIKIVGDRKGWRLADGSGQVRVIPLLDSVRATLGALDRARSYVCRLTFERIESRENSGVVVTEITSCRPG